ncbi:MAG: hypothetical protein FD146_1541 [Anaerolineaceae bacterium]|nr:MAG: hypothetical protein FD146_1541 [Anaerolineaceae bacterium]
MNEVLSNVIVIIILAVLGGGIFLFARRRQAAAEKRLAQTAQEHGWQLETVREPLVWGMRITGRGWTLEALSRSSGAEAGPGSSNVAMSTRWQADRGGSTLALGPRRGDAGLAGQFAGPLMRKFTGADMREVQLKDAALAGKYMLWAENPAEAGSLFTPGVEAAMLAWKKVPPVVRRDGSGLQMEIAGERLKKPDDLLAFIRIGEALLDAAA